MILLKEIKSLLQKEFLLEWRERTAFYSLILYAVSSITIAYLSFRLHNQTLQVFTWNALFWIILLFASISAVTKSFLQEKQGRWFYYYTMVSPESIILSKIIYNTLILILLSIINLVLFAIFMDFPVQDSLLFIFTVILGSMGFSSTLTLIAALASKTENSSVLMAILSFPIILPLLLILMKLSKNALDGLAWSVSYDEIIISFALNVLVLILSLILFPFLWKS
jgi:heme exporter protein B